LLPLYDEYLIAYKDRSAALDAARWRPVVSRNPFSAAVVVDGQVVGGWSRSLAKTTVTVTVILFAPIPETHSTAIAAAVRSYGSFLDLEPKLSLTLPFHNRANASFL
jgi:hypothetical protein